MLNRGDGEHADPTAQHIGGHAGVWANVVAFQAPRDGQGLIALADHAGELGKLTMIHNIGPKGEGNYLGSL